MAYRYGLNGLHNFHIVMGTQLNLIDRPWVSSICVSISGMDWMPTVRLDNGEWSMFKFHNCQQGFPIIFHTNHDMPYPGHTIQIGQNETFLTTADIAIRDL